MSTELITGFYEAFARRDGAAMSGCYATDARFSDPVFPDLRGAEVGAMWRMLAGRAADLRVVASNIAVDGDAGRAHWEAWYTFSATGRAVHNIIEARFEIHDGRIVRHVDDFSFWRWSRQALGAAGLALGWTPIVRGKVRAQAAAGLATFMQREGLVAPPGASRTT